MRGLVLVGVGVPVGAVGAQRLGLAHGSPLGSHTSHPRRLVGPAGRVVPWTSSRPRCSPSRAATAARRSWPRPRGSRSWCGCTAPARPRAAPTPPRSTPPSSSWCAGCCRSPTVLEVRRGDPATDQPGLLLTSLLPGERLDLVLPRLDDEGLASVGAQVGRLLGRLGHMVQPRAGRFADRSLLLADLPVVHRDLAAWLEDSRRGCGPRWARTWWGRCVRSPTTPRTCSTPTAAHVLVHADLNPKNVLVDPGTLEITGLLDWEFAHAGSPWSDLGNVLRFERTPAYADAVVAAYVEMLPGSPPGPPRPGPCRRPLRAARAGRPGDRDRRRDQARGGWSRRSPRRATCTPAEGGTTTIARWRCVLADLQCGANGPR